MKLLYPKCASTYMVDIIIDNSIDFKKDVLTLAGLFFVF